MIAKSTTPPAKMKQALAHTVTALSTASELDTDRSDDDRYFFAAKHGTFDQLLNRLMENMQLLETYNLKESLKLQLCVEFGDSLLDRAVSDARKWMKLVLKEKSSDKVNYVFGSDVTVITKAKIKVEPYLVLEALQRLRASVDFEGKDKHIGELEKRANQQIANLQARDLGKVRRSELLSKLVNVVGECADALYQLNHELLLRFPQERDYVARFFLDVTPKKKSKDDEDDEETAK